jgi:hypothetical protein
MLPNFIIIGSMKCGTTSLAYYLSQHPDIFISNPDKIYFFSDDERFNKGTAFYESFFVDANQSIAIGEGSDDYTKGFNGKSEKAAERIKKLIPDCKLIFLAKHPLKQIESSWLQRYANSSEDMPFNEAVIHSKKLYVETANYKKQLQHYIDRFPEEQLKVFFTEDLALNPEKVIKSCFSFLGVNSNYKGVSFNKKNISSQKNFDLPITRKLRKISFLNSIMKQSSPYFKSFLKQFLTTNLNKRPEWEYDTLKHVIHELWEDSQDFLNQHGKEKSFWNLDEYNI